MKMTSNDISFKELYARIESFGKRSIELEQLKAIDTSSAMVTQLVFRISLILIVSLFLFVFSIGAAIWIGTIFEEMYYGFLMVMGFYMVLGFALYFFMHQSKK